MSWRGKDPYGDKMCKVSLGERKLGGGEINNDLCRQAPQLSCKSTLDEARQVMKYNMPVTWGALWKEGQGRENVGDQHAGSPSTWEEQESGRHWTRANEQPARRPLVS